jgi:hypothetical protein
MTDTTNKISAKPANKFENIGKYIASKLWRKAKKEINIAQHVCNAVLYYSIQNKLQDSL